MPVERQVVGGERDVGREQGLQAPLGRLIQSARRCVPEQTMMHEHEVGAQLGRPREELELSGDAGHDMMYGVRPGHLQAVGSDVGEAIGLQERVDAADEG